MKTKIGITMIIALLLGLTSYAQKPLNKSFKVYGNCGMCEKRIEKAAKSVEGVKSADWNKKSKIIKVTFNSQKTNIHKVHMAIAKVGHDTDMHKADDKVYNKLAKCCKYKRATNSNKQHKH